MSDITITIDTAQLTISVDDHVLSEGRAVTVIVYGDFQCEFTREAAREMRAVLAHEDDVSFAFRYFPLSKHPDAYRAACTAEVAARHGHFWEMYDLLFEQDGALKLADLRACAERLGIDRASFDAELTAHEVAGRIDRDLESGRELGVTGTPTFFVGGAMHHGDHSVELIRGWVQQARAAHADG